MATNKQKALAKKILQDPSKELGKAMKEVGYSPNTRPHDVTQTKTWEELMETYLPDEKLARVHSEGLEALKIHGTDDNFIEIPDHATRAKYLELGYKVKHKMPQGMVGAEVNDGKSTVKVIISRGD